MTTQPPANDPRNIWQNQSLEQGEQTNMSLQDLRERLRRLQAKSRREGVGETVIGLAVLAVFAAVFVRADAVLERFAFGLFILGTLAAVVPHTVQAWRNRRRENLAPEMAMTTCIQFYRRLLEPNRTYEQWTAVCLLLIFFGMMLILLPMVSSQIQNPTSGVALRNILPFSLILVFWGVSFILIRRRHQRWLRRELEILAALERENGPGGV
jgi:hypothetical protein